MKNIHILPTDKPSRYVTNYMEQTMQWQNIFITSDEEIKEGDCSFYPPFGVGKNIVIDGELCFHIEAKNGKGFFTQGTYQTLDKNKKIILTTDTDLISDGVQSIDDEFLEWFVKNPSCESVETKVISTWWNSGVKKDYYKIIIPKEEPCTCKKHDPYCCQIHGSCPTCVKKEEPKETLEEAAKRISKEHYVDQSDYWAIGVDSFKRGAKWQAERMYSEEEVIKIVEKSRATGLTAEYLLLTEQFKKK